ncbi:MMPL family transporter [Conexibacter sp. JD483]|uniref:MMPL family transporter n=1 Tax=unclassified Conexibacter TaxID=2627773 RepID=UPI00271FC8EE|nr:MULTISPECIES: MMPL family transporter [unclassified Conexibacter]MDO8185705.1 MMPL family transporter [Conexibacter sp. CPCC 205706]MDO8199082.1 MMPL family transporter [Conexibacter sp. CPCC 205762]MDR9370499.1 MMPL family transporter [Conexibacter sp. JD483]
MQRENFAARAGRWSAQHRKTAILGWIAFVIVAFMAGNMAGTRPVSDRDSGTGESGRAERVLYDAFPQQSGETVFIQSPKLTASDAQFRAAVDDVVTRMQRLPAVARVSSPYAEGNGGQITADGHAAIVQIKMRASEEDAEDDVGALLAQTRAAARAHPELRVEQFGDASAGKALGKMFEDDFKKAEILSIPVTLLILIAAFGALVAAGLPLLLALSSVMATLGLVALGSHVIAVEDSVSSVVLLIGLAVGVDYSLFYLRREREERAAGRSEEAALQAAAATSGRAVLISGLTVMIAMAGMFITGDSTFMGMGMGAILVVGVSLIASLTVLPALLSKLGDKVDRGRIPFVMRKRDVSKPPRVWGAVIDAVLRRPLVSALISGGLLLALCIPVLGMKTAVPGIETLPRSLPVMQTFDRIQSAFPGQQIEAEMAVSGAGDLRTPQAQAALGRFRRAALATGTIHEPITIELSRAGDVARIGLPIDGDGTNAASHASLGELRGQLAPALRAELGRGADTAVTGTTAGSQDFNDLMSSRIFWVFAFVLTLAFLLLLVTFRSIVIATKAIVLNLLSVGAAYGVLVLVFQHTWAESLLSFDSTGAITSWLPLFLFVVLFGLSMDYHVFILSRVREAYDRGMSTDRAVAHGIKTTASTVTSAAIIMVAVFAIFATLSAIEFKQLGVGLAVAIFIDATLVRAVLLPATMSLLGDWNWYLPRWLGWLPQVTHEPPVEPLRPEAERERELAGV